MSIKILSVLGIFVTLCAAVWLPNRSSVSTMPAELPSNSDKTDPDNPVELGAVHWLRDLNKGKALAESSGKPLLILFQEVPGCSNCTQFGATTLSHPLIVEAIESLFVPVCIYNNKGGNDAAALERFKEPAWNNPVVRIVRADYSDLTPRVADFRASWRLVAAMVRALDQAGKETPKYLELLDEELRSRAAGLETATFKMYCYWTGEGTFGDIPGVIETSPGYQDGNEVVRVTFDPTRVTREALAERTQPKGFSACSKNEGFRNDREPKYYLSKTNYRFIPMTSLQACRANSLVGRNQSPEDLLSARQIALLEKIKALPSQNWQNMIGRNDLIKAWAEVHKH